MRHALDADSRNDRARLTLATALRRNGSCDEAVDEYAIVVERAPDHVAARLQRTFCLAELGRWRAARAWLEESIASVPRAAVLTEALVRILAASPDDSVRDGARALALAQRLLAVQRSATHLESTAMALAESGRHDEAAALQRELLASLPASNAQDIAAHFQRALATYESGDASRSPWPPSLYRR